MKKPKQNYSADLKAQVVLEALEGNKVPIQIGIERGIHVTSVNNWVREAKSKLSAIFWKRYCNFEPVFTKTAMRN